MARPQKLTRHPLVLPEQGIVHIPLTRGMIAIIDIDDLPKVEKWNWIADGKPSRNVFYAMRVTPASERINGKRGKIRMHNSILKSAPGFVTDHIDGNGLNNRRSNLRTASHSENGRNRQIGKNNKSGVTGVCWHKGMQRWHAQISRNNHNINLGTYTTIEEAKAVYQDAARELAGRFSRG